MRAAIALVVLAGCGAPRAIVCADARDTLAGDAVCKVPGHDGRDFLLHLPPSYDRTTPIPVVLVLHGGGGKKESADRTSCAGGDVNADNCMRALADREGFAVVQPDGTAAVAGSLRTWNAGGGADGFQCVSGRACKNGVDDVAYFDALLDELARAIAVDDHRVYATGLSNGAAMSHRLACERADRIAAIAPVGGGNQVAAVQGCAPSRPVPVLEIHGTDDPCWQIGGGTAACAQDDGDAKVSIDDTLVGTEERPGWARRNGCGLEPVVTEVPDAVDDGTTSTEQAFPNCTAGADVVFWRIDGGGHTWPNGWSYLSESTVGKVSKDRDGNARIWEFFAAHPRP